MKSLFLPKHSFWQHFCTSLVFLISFHKHRSVSLILQDLVTKLVLHILCSFAFKSNLMYLSDNIALKISSVHYMFLWDLVLTVKKAPVHAEKRSQQSSFSSDRQSSTVRTAGFQSKRLFYALSKRAFFMLCGFTLNPDSLFPLLLPLVQH